MQVKTYVLKQMSVVQPVDNENARSTRWTEWFPVKQVVYFPSHHLLNQIGNRKMLATPGVDDSTIAKNSYAIDQLHGFLQTMGNVGNGNTSIAEFPDNSEQVG